VVYASHRIMEISRALVQTPCSVFKISFDIVRLKISAVKSKDMAFSRKHLILASSLILGYAGVHKYVTCKDDACKD
jgi:hypothetical protein